MYKSCISYYLLFGFNNNLNDWMILNCYHYKSSLRRYLNNHPPFFSDFRILYYDSSSDTFIPVDDI